MSLKVIFTIPVNPEPWAIGPIGVTNKSGKPRGFVGQNQQLRNYQDAVKANLEAQIALLDHATRSRLPVPYNARLDMYFWRRLDEYVTTRKSSRNWADATNMQKALEDAIQGVLIVNDRNNIQVSSTIVEQGAQVKGGSILVIEWSMWENFKPDLSKLDPEQIERALAAFSKMDEFVFDNQV